MGEGHRRGSAWLLLLGTYSRPSQGPNKMGSIFPNLSLAFFGLAGDRVRVFCPAPAFFRHFLAARWSRHGPS